MRARAVLSTGSAVEGEPEHVAVAVHIDRRMQAQTRGWVAELRAAGVRAAHPDDGWVERDRNRVHLCYPQFDDGLEVGDRLALGGPPYSGTDRTRIVTVTGFAPCGPIMAGGVADPDRYYIEFVE